MLDKYPPIPEEGQRNREDLVEMLFAYAAKLHLLGNWCDFHFDTWSDCAGCGKVDWYIGVATDPDYGDCTDILYTTDDPIMDFDEMKCVEWIETFHGFLQRHEQGLDVDGNELTPPCVNCKGANLSYDVDCEKHWCLDCDDWATIKHPHMTEYDAENEYNPEESRELI